MTSITKTTFRVSVGALDGSFGCDRGRKLVAALTIGDLLELRPQGTRRAVRLSLFDVYRMAVRCRVNAVERKAKELKKLNGGKLATARKLAIKELGVYPSKTKTGSRCVNL